MSSKQSKDTYNKKGFFVLIFTMVFVGGLFIYVSFIYEGIDLGEVREQRVPLAGVPAVETDKPWVESEALIAYGKKVYGTNCLVCHGQKGRGKGPGGANLVPPPRDLIEGDWKKGGGRLALFKTLNAGLPGTSMASFAHLSPLDKWALVHFVRSITENKVKDDDKQVEKVARELK